MRTTDFSKVLFDALQFSGNDRQNISAETFAQFRDFAQFRLREAWESNQWPDIVRIAPFTTITDAPEIGQNSDTSGITYFIPDANASEILGVWNRNPQDSSRAVAYNYNLYDNGTTKKVIVMGIVSEGWYLYRLPCPVLTGDVFDTTIVYHSGVQIYFDSGSNTGTLVPVAGKPHSGNFYTCAVTSTTAGQSPSTTPSSWVKIDIPYIFGSYMSWGCTANWLQSEMLLQEAGAIEGKAKEVLELEYDKLLRQQAQFGKINMSRTY